MRKLFAALLAFAMIFSLCACGSGDGDKKERDCGVFITIEANDIYTVSCGTSSGSESSTPADGSAFEPGTVLHFDFAGDAAEGSDAAVIDYSICAYDQELDLIADGSFSDDFANMAKYNIVITEDHHILYEGHEYSCGGDSIITYEDLSPVDGVSIMSAQVTMPARPEAAAAVNKALAGYNETFAGDQYESNKAAYGKNDADGEAQSSAALEPFSMSRTVRVMRGDSAVLSFRMADRVNLGNKTTLAITCHSFDPQTGKELGIGDIAADTGKFTDFCAERVLIATTEEERFLTESMIFVEGYTNNIRALISDGHWYFSSEGIVIAANPGDISTDFYEFVIPYEDLADVLNEEYLPSELKGSYGNISLQLTSNVDLSSLNILGTAPDESINSMVMTVAGNVYNVNVYTGSYNTSTGKFTQDRQLIFCSDMMRGAAIAVNRAPAQGTPDLMVSFTCPDGTARHLLVSEDSANGGLLIMDLDGGNEGIAFSSSLSYDLNGDGSEEKIKIESGEAVSLTVGSETLKTEIKSGADARIYDLNGDGIMEIYLGGTLENGETATYCFTYSGKLALLGEPIPGLINEFNGNRVFLLAELDVLGKHPANVAYYYDSSANRLVAMDGFEYIFDGEQILTTAVSIALKDGTSVPAGTKLTLNSTDGASYVKVTVSGGSGVLSIAKDTMGGWTVNGQPAAVCFKELA
ncbi:MAG: hypothetical protein Q4A83_08155 [Bacillota bacterium]|nr:hypothetical protein [Bacillota bacterium]